MPNKAEIARPYKLLNKSRHIVHGMKEDNCVMIKGVVNILICSYVKKLLAVNGESINA